MLTTSEHHSDATARRDRAFRIRATVDIESTRTVFGEDGRVSVPHFVNGESARALYRELCECDSWGLRICDGERMAGLPPKAYADASTKERTAYMAKAYTAAQSGFAFMREELWPVTDGAPDLVTKYVGATGTGQALAGYLHFVRAAEFSNFVREVFGVRSVTLVRLTVECYKSGHFFGFTKGAPPDAEFGFCFDLTPSWISEWGGLLEFCTFSGGLAQTYMPRFNCITLYRLSKSRGISFVTPFARRARYSIVGQLADG
jgi:SM-20-related protein